MEPREIHTKSKNESRLRILDTLACVAAIILAFTTGCGLRVPARECQTPSSWEFHSFSWTMEATSPLRCMLRTLTVLLSRSAAMVERPKTRDGVHLLHNRRAFVWRCFDRITTAVP